MHLFFSDEHLNNDGDTSSSIKTESGNPSNRCTETDRKENEQAEKNKVDKMENQVKDDKVKKNYAEGLESGGRGEKRQGKGENGNRKRKKEEEDKGGGLKSKEVKKESGKDADEKVDMKDKDQEKTRESIGQENEKKGGRNEKEDKKDDGLGGGTAKDDKASEKDNKGNGDGYKAEKDKEKEDDKVERKKRDLKNGKIRDEDGQKEERQGIESDPLLRSPVEGASSTNVVASQEYTAKNQQQSAHTSDVTGKLPGSSKENQTKKVSYNLSLL